MTSVDAVGLGGAQTQFISQAQYRAWGALKSRTQANTTLTLTYNQQLLPKTYSYGGGQVSYEYHNDGSVKFADDLSGSADVKDRAYSYDAAGRIQHAYSGVEARNFVNNTSGGTPDGPYDHQYGYDHWGNLLQDSGRFWSRTINTQDNFDANNRNPAWSYDAEGNLLSRNELATTVAPFVPARYKYDAAGRQVGSTQTRTYHFSHGNTTTAFVNTQTFDGDNQLTHYALVRNHTSINLPPSSETAAEAYMLRSTVLGGSVISEYKGDGTWSKSHVYAGGERLGQQSAAETGTAESILETLDPITGDEVKRLPNGTGMGHTTMNPGGVDVGVSDPFPPDGSGGLLDEDLGKTVASLIPIEGFGARCMLDGLEIDCSRIRGTTSVQCPNNDCTATITFTERRDGRAVGRWISPAPEGWDPSFDGTYRLGRNKEEKVVWKRQGSGPGSGLARFYAFDNGGLLQSAKNLSQHIVNQDLLKNVITSCVNELYPMFKMTSFKATTAPQSAANDDSYNGIIGIKGRNGSSFNLINDPTPPEYIKTIIKKRNGRGATPMFGNQTGDTPFWSYACPTCDQSGGEDYGRPAERRYPELYRAPAMTYIRVQIHELGAALTFIRNAYYPTVPPELEYPRRLPDNGLYKEHEDDGPAMEECVGRNYYNLTGLKPH